MKWKFILGAFVVSTALACGSSDDPGFSNNPKDGGGGGGGDAAADSAAQDGSNLDAAPVSCTEDVECTPLLTQFTPSPAGCAEAYCEKASGTCRLRPVDQDADGYRDANCDVPGLAGFAPGNDCDDGDTDYFPGKSRNCSESSDGTPISWPTGTPVGACKYGTQECGTDGKGTPCSGAVAPAAADTCAVAGSDENCNGTANEECGCGVVGEEEACGPCSDGKRVCQASGTWGACVGAQLIGQPCGSCGGVVECGGGCSVPTPNNYGNSCNSCSGTIQCNGSCSPAAPSNFGQSCNSCGGTITCSGACSTSQPSNYGQSCNSCGGTITCSGACSTSQPSNYGQSCNSCGGTFQCNGSCSPAQPSNYGHSCNACGSGVVGCNGSCSAAAPPNLGASCGQCGGVWQCQTPGSNALTCSKATPSNYNQVAPFNTYYENFTCCYINYNKVFGGTCTPGWVFSHATVTKAPGSLNGQCYLNATIGGGSNCTASAHFENLGTDGANCIVTIYQRRVCDP